MLFFDKTQDPLFRFFLWASQFFKQVYESGRAFLSLCLMNIVGENMF